MELKTRTGFATLAFTLAVSFAHADYEEIWSCDFGESYESQKELLTPGDGAVVSQGIGTNGVKDGKNFLLLSDEESNTVVSGITSIFTFPSAVKTVGEDWQMEFDYAPSYGKNDHAATSYGLKFYGANDALLFNLDGKKNDGGIDIYAGQDASTPLANIPVASLSRYDNAAGAGGANWLHVTVTGSKSAGNVTLAITHLVDNSAVSLSSDVAYSSFASPGKIEIKTASYMKRHQWAGFDDIAFRRQEASAEPVAMILVGGQSNTEGRLGADSLPDYLESNEYALVSAHTPLSETQLGKFAAYAPASGDAGQPSQWAYDAELYYHIGQALGKAFYVAKTSYGGTSINPATGCSPSSHANRWLSSYGGGYHWSADEEFLAATVSAGRTFEKDGIMYDGQSMLEAWIENIDAAIDALVADGKTPVVKAIVWHQGESDKNDSGYAEKLIAVVGHVRSHLAMKLGDDNYLTLPFFCGNIPRRSSLYSANIDRQFAAIESDTENNMHVVDIYDLTMKSDNKHFDAESAIVFGKRLFNRMIAEGVISGEEVSVADCVRSPDFGVEQVVNNTTTWTWQDESGDIATGLSNIDGIYFHAGSTDSRKIQTYGTGSQTLNWEIGDDATPTTVTQGAYCTGYADNGSELSTTSTAGESNSANYMAAVNVGRTGAFELFFWANKAGTAKLYLNGVAVATATADAVGDVLHLKAENTGKAVYYFGFDGKGAIVGARFVPAEEMVVSLTIGESGWGTFGNLEEASFALPEGVKAYAIAPVHGQPSLLSMAEVGALNLGEAVVVSGTAGTYKLVSGEGVKYDGENLMVIQKETGAVEATSGSDFINFLQDSQDGKPVFTKSDGTQTLEAGKAFFSITEGDEHSQQDTLVCRITGDTSKFAWTGNGDDTLWSTLANWAWPDGETPLNAPGDGASVTFDADASVTFDADTATGGVAIVVNADVAFASDNSQNKRIVYPASITGEGKLILGDMIELQTVTYRSFAVECALEIADGASVSLYSSGNGASITLNGALTGSGSVSATNRNGGGSITINSDMSGFTGTLTTGTTGTTTIAGETGDKGVAVNAANEETAKAKFTIVRPSGVTDDVVTQTAYEAYFTKAAVEKEDASGVYLVSVALDADVVAPDYTFATINSSEIVDGDAFTLMRAKPGLYYSIVGGTDVKAIEFEGERTLATGTTVAPPKPELGNANCKYYRLRISSRREPF